MDFTNIERNLTDSFMGQGLQPPPLPLNADGEFHRFPTRDKRGDTNGWYLARPSGVVFAGCWRTGFETDARSGEKLTKAQKADFARVQKQVAEEKQRKQSEAAKQAQAMWDAADPDAGNHSYIHRKGIAPHGARVATTGDDTGSLLVPMHDIEGKLWNLERITDESKKGLYGGRRDGLFYPIGQMVGASRIVICEGYATAASIHEATGLPVAAAFNAGNLVKVAKSIADKYQTTITIAADDDYRTPGNPGHKAAKQAAAAVGGDIAVPVFKDRPDGATDFNDLFMADGAAAVAAAFDSRSDDPPVATEFPPRDARPCYVVTGRWIESGGRRYKPGVYHCTYQNESHQQTFICGELHILALTHDHEDNNHGRLLKFRNVRGQWREYAAPMEMLKSDGSDLRGVLLSMGLELDIGKSKLHLGSYLQHRVPKRQIRCASQTGWYGDSFVLPRQVIGGSSEVIFQAPDRVEDDYQQAGTLDGWQQTIARVAIDNPALLLSISTAFAGALMKKCHVEGGGVHLYGDSSTGKSTGLEAAASVWGGEGYKRSWRATSNGLEGAAAVFNDGLLCLDEISECDPRQVGEIAYLIGNGIGKQRASRSGSARRINKWRCMVLSTGERTLETAMAEAGHRAKAGQSVRILDVPVVGEHGLFDCLHEFDSGRELSDYIKTQRTRHHGVVGIEYLKRLTADDRDFGSLLEQLKATARFNNTTSGQVKRAASRFALVGMAGELATEYGITGWPEGAAIEAAIKAFSLWRQGRDGNQEKQQALLAIRDFIDRHGDSRFSARGEESQKPINDRAGYWEDGINGRVYLFNTSGFKQAIKGYELKSVLDILEAEGVIPKSKPGAARAKMVKAGGTSSRYYEVSETKLAEVCHGY